MKKITQEEFEKLHFKKQGQIGIITKAIIELNEGEILFISRKEWEKIGYKTSPSSLISSSKYHPRSFLRDYKFMTKMAEEGWVIKLLKKPIRKEVRG